MFWLTNRVRRNVLVATTQGYVVVNRFDPIGQTLLNVGHYGEEDIAFVHQYLNERNRESLTIFDIGAGAGTFSTWAANVFPTAEIYSFEPQRAQCELLMANAAINNFYGIHAYNMALGDQNTWLTYQEPNYLIEADFNKFSVAQSHDLPLTEKIVTVEQRTVDSFVSLHRIASLDLLKITTNDMDVAVLHGALETIKKFRPVIYIDYTFPPDGNRNDIVAVLEQNNYGFKGTLTKILAVYDTEV